MLELNELGISGLAISVEEDKEAIPQQMIEKAKGIETVVVLYTVGGCNVC